MGVASSDRSRVDIPGEIFVCFRLNREPDEVASNDLHDGCSGMNYELISQMIEY